MDEHGPDPDRRAGLLAIKLRALVAGHLGVAVERPAEPFGAGAALVVDDAAWVLIDGPAERRLGAALAWAVRHGASSLDVIADRGGGTIARRAQAFDFPVSVWFAQDRLLLPVVPEVVERVEPQLRHLEYVEAIQAAGATANVEHGVVTGEVRGLEVCRVVDEPTTGNLVDAPEGSPGPDHDRPAPSDGAHLEVGVGANDREAFRLVHGDEPAPAALARVVAAVTEHRSSATARHPLNRMAPERFLRWRAQLDPSSLGLRSLAPAEPPVVRRSMKQAEPCVAHGVDHEGGRVLAVFSAGVDLDLAPFVADVLVAEGIAHGAPPDADVVVVLPERDLVPITRDLLDLISRPVRTGTLDGAAPAAQ
ncbi:hypothetical protein [Ilumatobacter sp.]|uniref:hypothetical protein n=1 Tax=Ilumatobacter sp. TaxID=1967498 RepID=UPI003B52249F